MILITGASGKTGRAVLKALALRKAKVRVLAHTSVQAEQLLALGAKESLCGDFRDMKTIQHALNGVDRVYHICPNVSPDEYQIGTTVISEAKAAGVGYFVYHSVLHPQVEAMPHHWQKMQVEEALFNSGMDFTILQPCTYMQNILAGWKSITNQGIYSVPYSINAKISIVDLEDIGLAAAKVLTSEEFRNGIYELSGPQPLSQIEVAETISKVLGTPVQAVKQELSVWISDARNSGMVNYQVETLVKMFEYYDKYGLVGNSQVLKMILRKPPRNLTEMITWYNQSSRNEG
jgi:uncharacterized protein YbjT (DUF2867 family)